MSLFFYSWYMKKCTPAQKRFFVAISLGIFFGFLCSYLASSSSQWVFWWTPLMWAIVTDRMIIGLAIGMAGAYMLHPIFRFPCPPALRGFILGAIFSLPLAIGGMISPTPDMTAWMVFWYTMWAGAVYGLLIDMIATKIGWQGDILLK